jgi:drug/metabolite transporter (DMT)-like permease
MSLAAIVLLALNASSLRGLRRQDLRLAALAGLFLALGYQLQTAGLARTTPSKSAFITGLVVVFVPLLSMVPGVSSTKSSRPGLAAIAGAVIAFLGLILLTSQPGSGAEIPRSFRTSGFHTGEWLTLACALAFAAHLLTLDRASKRLSARHLGTLQIAFAALFMLLTLPLGGRSTLHWTPLVLIALAVTALLATAAAFTIQSWAQQHLPPTHTALILTMEPVFAALISLLFLHEHFSRVELVGAALILAGILLAELLPGRLQPTIQPSGPTAIPSA